MFIAGQTDISMYSNLWEVDQNGMTQMDYFERDGICFTQSNTTIDNAGWTVKADQSFQMSRIPIKFSWFQLELVQLDYLEDAIIN